VGIEFLLKLKKKLAVLTWLAAGVASEKQQVRPQGEFFARGEDSGQVSRNRQIW
jgi:hypothetical protein